MGKSAKFFKRPTRKEKAVLSLSKEDTTSFFDAANAASSSAASGRQHPSNKKDILSTTANHTISKKTSASASSTSTGAHPPKASLAYKLQMNGGIKQAVKDLESLDNAELVSEDEAMEDDDDEDNNMATAKSSSNKKKQDMDKTKPRPDYVELMYGKPQSGNKRKTFMPKPALIK
ncbi:hypothetical protein BGZ99_003384 [Dissophora globulifera]|uniref:Uncharacterized protein n=1 Tax=Dissophora globulifera TaxID=979702 RepID=A0A9P6RLF7_9FUNG|nr:hypothetical protein BGZ99_003384 [Dissophora globulifera]